MYKMHHPKADIDRLNVQRKGGGRGLLQIKVTHKADTDRLNVQRKGGGRGLLQITAMHKVEIINTAEYLNTNYKEDQFVNIVRSHESNKQNTN
jgi:hypothetical protein